MTQLFGVTLDPNPNRCHKGVIGSEDVPTAAPPAHPIEAPTRTGAQRLDPTGSLP